MAEHGKQPTVSRQHEHASMTIYTAPFHLVSKQLFADS